MHWRCACLRWTGPHRTDAEGAARPAQTRSRGSQSWPRRCCRAGAPARPMRAARRSRRPSRSAPSAWGWCLSRCSRAWTRGGSSGVCRIACSPLALRSDRLPQRPHACASCERAPAAACQSGVAGAAVAFERKPDIGACFRSGTILGQTLRRLPAANACVHYRCSLRGAVTLQLRC